MELLVGKQFMNIRLELDNSTSKKQHILTNREKFPQFYYSSLRIECCIFNMIVSDTPVRHEMTNNILSIVIFVLFAKTLSSLTNILTKTEVNVIVAISSCLNLISSFILIQILLSAKFNNFYCKLIEFSKNIPLTLITYLYLTLFNLS
ncbi:hypothetical protein BpHYR1_021375 [Brachionus plicatilis]|uniref:Uncharacterized protein n=1 Tax=Brachionus plicatilis TaxID=10195 RepID=A0A3M7R789_BRAPC|nr:hypothetical protein BpHYR1_021375 [Brachionus plicatilis]